MNQPFPNQLPWQQPQQPAPQQPAPAAWQQPQQPAPMQPAFNPGTVAQGAQVNAFQQMLLEPPKKRADRNRPADGTHVVQFTRETIMETSQATMQPYLMISYVVIESTVPQMVNQTFKTPMMLANRWAVQALTELAKVVFGPQNIVAVAQQFPSPLALAQVLVAQLANPQTGVGMHALLNTWRSKKGKNGGPPPSYDEAFVNHDWLLVMPQLFSLAQAQAAGHRVQVVAPPAPPVVGAAPWGAPPMVPAQQQAFNPMAPAQPAPAAAPAFNPPNPMAPMQQFPPQQQPPAVHFPSQPPGFPPVR